MQFPAFVAATAALALIAGLAAVPAAAGDPPAAEAPADVPGLHHFKRLSDHLLRGAQPEGDEAFAALARMGVKTVVSVDGSRPDVAAAERHGLRYVHVPIGYDGIPDDKALLLAKAFTSLPGPFYVHCHHGKHRGPAACALGRMILDGITPEDAVAEMKAAGTDPKYVGLYAAPVAFTRPDENALAKVGVPPSAAPVPAFAQAMVEVDASWDRLKAVQKAGWATPADHPDVEPAHEAVILAEHFRELGRREEVAARPEAFRRRLADSEKAASDLAESLKAEPLAADAAKAAFDRVAKSCADCHAAYRDVRPAAGAAPPSIEDGAALDPALLRRRILARMDARIDEAAAKAHLDARLVLDETMPIPYLGVDAEPDAGAMRLTKVYPGTCAEAAGLRVGDAIVAFGCETTDSKAALGRAIRKRAPGAPVEMRLLRDGKETTVTTSLGKRPEEDEDEDEQFPDLPGEGGAPPSLGAPRAFDFEKDAEGGAPAGLESLLGGHGSAPRWIVTADAGGRFLRQDDGDPTGIRFPLALVRGFEASDAVARVRFRYAGGQVDKAAGIVLRFKDPANYLVARVNAAEADLRIFRVANGLRRTLPGSRVEAPCDDDRWHVLEFRAEGPKVTATLDGKVTSTSYDTYFLRGRAGLWTKSDSRTDFDDWTVSGR